MNGLYDVYRDTYLGIRAKYQHPDEPIRPTGEGYCFPEALPPKQGDAATYAAYFNEVGRLGDWYKAARAYASKKRKRPEDRAAYIAACDRLAVAGHDLRFAGESEPALF